MRCPDCNKFVPYDDTYEPECDSLEVESGSIIGEVRVVLPCAECGTELKEAIFDIDFTDLQDDIEEHAKTHEFPDFEVEVTSLELTIRTEGKGRGTKTFYGYELEFEVKCAIDDEFCRTGTAKDDMQASFFDECC